MSAAGLLLLLLVPSTRAADPAASQRVYDTLFPAYAEVCTMTRLHTVGSKPGGRETHANLFLHGACRDDTAARPRLVLCDPSTDPADPRSGVGVSVNKVFANANWVAIPGRDEFFRGGLPADSTLDPAAFEAAVRRAAAQPWFDGLRPRPDVAAADPGVDPRELLVRKSIGTDFAITFARTAYCARIPMPRAALGAMVDFLNARNEERLDERRPWDPITNNCIHTVHNALAAAGIVRPKHTGGPGALAHARQAIGSLLDAAAGRMPGIALPANGYVRAFEAANERPIDDPERAAGNADIRRTFERFGWVSTGPGGLVAAYPQLPQSAPARFEDGPDPRIVSVPLVWDKKREFQRLAHDPPAEDSDLRANLAAFRDRYARILAEPERRAGHPGFRAAYRAYLRGELEDVGAKLQAYDRLTGAPGAP